MLFRISSKASAHRATENTEAYSILLHLDNAPNRDSRLSSEKIESATAQRVPHLHYNPDRAPSDFFLFGNMKEKLRGISFTARDDLIFARGQIFSEILEMVLKNVVPNSIMRAPWVTKKGGQSCTNWAKRIKCLNCPKDFDICHDLSNPRYASACSSTEKLWFHPENGWRNFSLDLL
jgi:hypothetical protein